ncbi:extracellular solute-binding protein [Halostagnicola sp. A-GB9-2]|uniref:ABC transporter substrate-binding protein n=1 Tax=Halostagnicola sp. A-GB9-2 TaxID=3048066 RepID=UPI0024C09BAF|nr:extracellular solute-binding protein [Halostagnicola sp. A-GB9-2]MDJ1434220.1 extracellular solute-binding protein [Halostagnicola sp. A-GB9-2]
MSEEPTREAVAESRRQNRTTDFSRRGFIGANSAIVLSALAGCIGSSGDGDVTLDPDNPPEEPDSITVRAWGGVWQDSVEEAIAEPFTEDTGIDVEFDNTERTVMQGDIRTAIEQDREPAVNVMWTVEPAAHEEYRMDLGYPLEPDIVTNHEELFDSAIPNVDDSLPYISLYSYTYALCYNEESLEEVHGSEEPMDSWAALKDDQWENEFAIDANGNGFFPVLSEFADTPLDSDDLDPIWDELEAFEPSIGLLGDDPTLTEGIRTGEVSVAAMLMNNVYEAYEEGEPIGWTIPEEGATVRSDSMYTPRNQSESELYWSQEFINYAADADVQTEWTELLGLPMTNSNTDPLDYMEEDPAYPTSEEDYDGLLTVDLDVYAENSSEWFETFNNTVGS